MRRPHPITLLAGAALVVGCVIEKPFARDNHWDVDGTARKRIVAPESTFSMGTTFDVALDFDPPLGDAPYVALWYSIGNSDSATHVYTAGDARFQVTQAHAEFQPVPIYGKFDDVIVTATVMVGQKLVGFDLFCGTGGAPVACDGAPLAVGATRTVNSYMADGNTNVLRRKYALMARAAVVFRTPGVVDSPTVPNAAGAWTIRGVATGSTWVVITADGVSDSVRFVVP